MRECPTYVFHAETLLYIGMCLLWLDNNVAASGLLDTPVCSP